MMLFDTNPSLFVFLLLIGSIIGGPIIGYMFVAILLWFAPSTPVNDLEQHAGIPLETFG